MQEIEKTLAILDQQCGDYRAMYQISLEQRGCIEREDVAGLEASFVRLHRLMDQIRLLQEALPALERSNPQVEQRCEKLRGLIVDLQEMRQFNQSAAERLLKRTRAEIRQFNQGQRAVQGYQSAQVVQARLFDGTR